MQQQSEVTQHITSIGPASFGQYQSRCSCGWQSRVTSDAEAVGLMREHERDNPIRRLEPKPDAEAIFCPDPDCVYPAGYESDHSPSAQPKPDAADEAAITVEVEKQTALVLDIISANVFMASPWLHDRILSCAENINALSAPRNSALEDAHSRDQDQVRTQDDLPNLDAICLMEMKHHAEGRALGGSGSRQSRNDTQSKLKCRERQLAQQRESHRKLEDSAKEMADALSRLRQNLAAASLVRNPLGREVRDAADVALTRYFRALEVK